MTGADRYLDVRSILRWHGYADHADRWDTLTAQQQDDVRRRACRRLAGGYDLAALEAASAISEAAA